VKSSEQLVKDALDKLNPPYSEDIVDEVFGIIEHDPILFDDYQGIIDNEMSKGSLNQNIGHYVKKLTDGEKKSSDNTCKKTTLAKKYSKFKWI